MVKGFKNCRPYGARQLIFYSLVLCKDASYEVEKKADGERVDILTD